MKLSKIWKKIGVQPLRITQHTDAIVFIGDEKYFIIDMKYDNGRPLGFNAIKMDCSTCEGNKECDIHNNILDENYCHMWSLKKEK